jgi:cation/acetate symporter
VALAFAIAASANLPTILYSLFWKKFTTRGALWSMYGGLGTAIFLIIFSPVVSGGAINPATGLSSSMLQGVDFHWFPLNNPGIISIPVGFLLGFLGTITATKKEDPRIAAEMDVRSLTGYGAEGAVKH